MTGETIPGAIKRLDSAKYPPNETPKPVSQPETAPLQRLQTLSDQKETAFLALFAGAFGTIHIYRHKSGLVQRPSWGKSECEWVEDWQDFYFRELVELGFMNPEKVKEGPALGMGDGNDWTFELWDMRITDDGFAAREAYWAHWNATITEIWAERSARNAQP